MIVLQESNLEQTFMCIPRVYAEDIELSLYDEQRNTTVAVEVTSDIVGDDYYVSGVFDLLENNFYVITLLSNDVVIFKDRVFCTNQLVADYSINAGIYVEQPDADNEYIII
jgi:hypothetical protein